MLALLAAIVPLLTTIVPLLSAIPLAENGKRRDNS
jgi:hypothetical protein